ncbi:MAG: circularly permuted type 2 ATP-grasp protein [Bdellovibrionaceae bacterium]|nr:circularly permuted type 2 ATP-grasp protein [Bdellovibrio sp.]
MFSLMTEEDKSLFLVESKQAFQGDNALDPMPRIISANEYDKKLKAGVQQRADALRAFLQDHYSGKKSYLAAGIISKEMIDRIIDRHHESGFEGKIDPNNISFMYGPDIIRDRQGQFRVVEDNPGWIGGVGDLMLAQDYTLFRFPQLGNKSDFRDARNFYINLANRYQERAKEKNGVSVLYMIPPYPDNEDKRIRQHYADVGIPTVTPFTRLQLKTTKDGVYLYDSKDDRVAPKKVGMVSLNGELHWLDPSNPENYRKLVLTTAHDGLAVVAEALKDFRILLNQFSKPELDREKINAIAERLPYVFSAWRTKSQLHQSILDVAKKLNAEAKFAKELKNQLASTEIDLDAIKLTLKKLSLLGDLNSTMRNAQMASQLTKLHFEGKVHFSTTPGLDFVGDKQFYMYVEKFIQFYLQQEPIIKNIETKSFANKDGSLSQRAAVTVFSNSSQYVIKKVDGRGGDSVWVGPKTKAYELEKLRKLIAQSPTDYIYQIYTPLSRLNSNIVDIRVMADVGPSDTFVSDTPWGRGLPNDGDGKVNISRLGREVTVLVRAHLQCANLFE